MKIVQSSLLCALTVLLTAGMAFGQQSGSGPAGGTGTGGGSTPGSTPGQGQEEIDLPVEQPVYQVPIGQDEDENDDEDQNNGDDEGDDPRDTPPPVIYGEEIDSENDTIFYVLDISCSMDWDSQSYTTLDGSTRRGPRIDRAKAELSRSIMGLAPNFKFNIVAYDCSTRQWQRDMQPADDANKASALAWSNALRPTGATGTGPATVLALGDKDNMAVVLLTDGAPNCPYNMNSHRSMIRTANTQGATINVFGIAASGSYRSFCQGVASDSGGSYFDVP